MRIVEKAKFIHITLLILVTKRHFPFIPFIQKNKWEATAATQR
jgi:hypothetical protein